MKKYYFFFFVSIIYCQSTNLDSLYYSYSEIQDSLYTWQERFGNEPHPFDYYSNTIIYQLDSIGVSTNENIPIYAVKLSVNANIEENQPKILLLGQCHAEEIYGLQMVMSLIEWFLYPESTPWANNELPMFLHNLEIWIVPTHNPEGLNVVHGYENEGGDWTQDVSYRKNKTDVNMNGIFDYTSFYPNEIAGNDSDGVDLNRNYGLNWLFGDDKYELNLQSCGLNQAYSSNYDYYKGLHPFSEKEIQSIRDFAIEKNFLFSIAYHSSRSGCVSERVIYPWSWGWSDLNGNEIFDKEEAKKASPDFTIIHNLADNIASRIQKENGGSYDRRPQKSRNGNAHDWIYSQTGCIQFLVEMGSSNIQPLDQELINTTVENNRKGLFYLLEESIPSEANDIQHVSGRVVDKLTGKPIEGAKYILPKFDSSVLSKRQTNADGYFHRILPFGNYNIEFIAEGYEKINLVVGQDQIENIELIPLEIKNITIALIEHDAYVSSGPLNISLTDNNGFIKSIEINDNILNNFVLPVYMQNYTLLATSEAMIPYSTEINTHISDTIEVPIQNKLTYQNLIKMDGWSFNGTWYFDGNNLYSQNTKLYNNNDVLLAQLNNIFELDSIKNVSIIIDLAYELEWDQDIGYFNITSPDTTIEIAKWQDQHWLMHREHYFITLEKGIYGFEFGLKSDESLNYRGLQIESLSYNISSFPLQNYEVLFPQDYYLSQNYPNPFNPNTTISFYLPFSQNISLDIYDIRGRMLSNVIYNKFYQAGFHNKYIESSQFNFSSGVYFYNLKTSSGNMTKKMLILR